MEVIMKISYGFLISLFLSGCATVDKNIDTVHPNEYGMSDDFNGKIFSIYCNGNDMADAKYVDDKCKEYMSEFAHEKGYDFFSVIGQDGGTKTSVESYTVNTPVTTYSNASVYSGGYSAYGYGSSTTYVPQTHHYTVTKHAKGYLFVLIDKAEKNKWQNYYKVSDYYIPEEKNKD